LYENYKSLRETNYVLNMSKDERRMDVDSKIPNISSWPQQANQKAGRNAFAQKFAGVVKAKPIPNAIKKKRNNFRLRKLIVPKAPLMVLNEMVGQVSYTFVDNPPDVMAQVRPGMPPLFTAKCQLSENGDQTFFGTGPSKQIAKNICAEHAIQAVVVNKSEASKKMEQKNEEGLPLKPNQMEDETPWAQLASLALFKLFNDWQAQGYQIPVELWKAPNAVEAGANGATPGAPAPSVGSQDSSEGGRAKLQQPAKKIPDNPTDRHPVQLLNELRGGVTYNCVNEVGTSPNVIFTLATDVEGKTYTGEGKNKKDAKRACAVQVLKVVYNINYPADEPMKE